MMARAPSALLFQYRLLIALLFPALALHALWLAVRNRNARYLRERLGFGSGTKIDVWLHAASVGEVNAALPLLRVLHERHPQWRLLLTTATITGAATAHAKFPAATHAFLPIDRTGGARRFIQRWQPRAALIIETELWPNLFAQCGERDIPIIIVNGRISSRTLSAPVWLRDLYEETLITIHAVLARSEEDRERFLALGAPGERIEVLDNIKFAAAPRGDSVEPLNLGRPFVLAASTREGEERLLLQAWENAGITSHLLVIAPRHPKRLPELLKEMGSRSVAVRSRGEAITKNTQIYIADTFGELPSLMAATDLVFMGGSLVPKGGQNLLEPAALGKAIVTGPHMNNFAVETSTLLREKGMVQVQNERELSEVLLSLLADDAKRQNLGHNAQQVVEARRDVAERYANAIERLLNTEPQSRPW